MNIEQLLQLGFAGGIATYLVWWITKKQDGKLDKITDLLSCVLEAIKARSKE
jgi:hypothetical protein